MSSAAAASHVSWKRVMLGVLLSVSALAADPELFTQPWLPVVLAAAFAGYVARRKPLDGMLFGGAHLLSAFLGESLAAPQLLASVSLVVLAVSGRPKFSLLMGSTALGLLLFCAGLKLRYGGSPLTWQDLRYFFLQFSDNVGVMATQPTLLWTGGAAILALVVAAIVVWKLDLPMSSERKSRQQRALARTMLLLTSASCAIGLADTARSSSYRGAWQMSEARASTPIATFLSTFYLDPKAEFRKVSTAQFAAGVKAAGSGSGIGAAGPRSADIVVFLQESQFNPRAIGPCPPSLCAMNVFGATKGTSNYGELRVHTYGGGTWLSEFTLATGLPHLVYGEHSGRYVSFNVAPGVTRSFVRSLKAAGYRTVAVYPVRGGMMNARMAYQAYGFDEFHDSTDLQLRGDFRTPDSDIHEAALKVLEAARGHGKPVYLLALTVFNHSQHGIMMDRVPQEIVADARKVFDDEAEAQNLADYVWRTREFERTMDKTRAAVLGAGRPSVLAWFGDHQPPFSNAPKLRKAINAARSIPSVPGDHMTWYNISTNFGAPQNARPRRIDIAFLPGLLAQRARVPLDDWLNANVLARERCDGLVFECAEPAWRDAYFSYILTDLQSIR